MIQCRIWSCKRWPGRPCCVGCAEWTCLNRCKNHPSRCKCSEGEESPNPPSRPGVPPPDGRRKLDYGEIARLYYDERLSQKEIAQRLGCSAKGISRAIRVIGGGADE